MNAFFEAAVALGAPESPTPEGKFVLTPNAPIRQVWISALSTSFKLDWDEAAAAFVLPKTGEALLQLIQRLLREHLGDPSITLA